MEPIGTPDTVVESAAEITGAVPQNLGYQPAPGDPPRWRIGTLSYTTRGLVVLFCWLVWGDFAWSIRDRTVTTVLTVMLRKFHASDLLVSSLLISFPQALVVLLSPMIAIKSDNHRGRWGRRIPFLIIPTPFIALSIIGLAFSPFLGAHLNRHLGVHALGLDRSVLLFFGLFWVIFEFTAVVANSVFGALVNDVVPRPVLGRYFALFRAVSLIVGMIFNWFLLGETDYYYIPIFVSVGLIYGVGFTLMCLNVKEGQYPPVPADSRPPTRLAVAIAYFKDCFSKPYYYWVYAAIILPALAFRPINAFNLYYSQSIGMSLQMFGKLTAVYFFISLLQTVPIGWLVDKFHPIRVAIVALILHDAASLYGGLWIHGKISYGIAMVATGTLSGTWLTAVAGLGLWLFPQKKFAQYDSAQTIVSSVATIIFGLFMGHFLDMVHHQYRYTYIAGFILDAIGLIATVVVFIKLHAYGGVKNYVAPD